MTCSRICSKNRFLNDFRDQARRRVDASRTRLPLSTFSLPAHLDSRNAKDCLVATGTGSDKTLPIALNILLDDPSKQLVTLTLSPLKRLQITQESDFNSRYGVPTVVINEDTPRDDSWWNVSSESR